MKAKRKPATKAKRTPDDHIAPADRNARHALAFRNLESYLCDLHCMAQLAMDAVADLDGAPPSDDQINLAIFSARHLLEMTESAKAQWYSDWSPIGNDAGHAVTE